ncbi:MAG: hypothetical protein ABWY05_06020 [Noviherbaspirillum sp.]
MNPRILDTLRNAPSLDLYELSLTVQRLLSDPVRILEIQKNLHVGAQVEFFHHPINALAAGKVLKLRPTEALVQLDGTNHAWWLPYPAIVADPAQRPPAAASSPAAPVADTIEFQVGDVVGFTDKYLREHVGTVVRLNQKTVSINCDGGSWRVSRHFLRKVIDI